MCTLMQTSFHVNKCQFLQSICHLIGHCRTESACYYTRWQQCCKRHSNAVEVETSNDSLCPMSQLLTHSDSPMATPSVESLNKLHGLVPLHLWCCHSRRRLWAALIILSVSQPFLESIAQFLFQQDYLPTVIPQEVHCKSQSCTVIP